MTSTKTSPKSTSSERDKLIGDECWKWWVKIQRTKADGTNNRESDAAGLAKLRRSDNIVKAASEPQTQKLYLNLHKAKFGEGLRPELDITKLATTAIVAHILAYIRPNTDLLKGAGIYDSTATLLGAGEPKKMSPIRCQNLVNATNPEDVMREFRAAVAILGNTAPIGDIAVSIFDWLDTEHADARKIRWLYAYHNQPNSEPGATAS
ncbi:MAG: type I-E CRISPR-associated protein Cse2/CasB [Hyphomicrobiaceae bacterium]